MLFVCLGNICRSPLAEGVFRDVVRRAGLEDRFLIDSAGTSNYHTGDAPDPRTVATAARRGLTLEHRARQMTRQDLSEFHYVLAMDAGNRGKIERLARGTAGDRSGTARGAGGGERAGTAGTAGNAAGGGERAGTAGTAGGDGGGIRAGAGGAVVRLFREFDPEAGDDLEVPDPYFGGEDGFEEVHDMVERTAESLLEYIRAEWRL